MLKAALDPASIAVIGASDNPHKVGGRPILFMKRYGYRGAIYPVNPGRATVQGLKAFSRLEDLPAIPDLAIVAVGGEEAKQAVEACAGRGVKVCVVMTSGFGETGEAGLRLQDAMVGTARQAGMRLVGPNCQGIANFGTGAIANFSTIFHELEARDGPVAIISQSGANSQAIYQLAYDKGLGIRHVHATGNEADVTVAELTQAVAADPGVGLILLYLESMKNPAALAAAAAVARGRNLPIVALKAGRTESGKRAASSHTGALASEDRVVDAFFERHGIWRADNPQKLVAAAELYLSGRRPKGRRLVFMSNSGASCVMAADHAELNRVPLLRISEKGKALLAKDLPAFAALDNPIDVTGALLTNSTLFGKVLPVVGAEGAELVLMGLPVAGMGYDVAMFARDLAKFQADHPHAAAAVAAPQESVRAEFRKVGVASFSAEGEAIDALAQLADHSRLLRKKSPSAFSEFKVGKTNFLNEFESLALLAKAGIPVIEHQLCRTEQEIRLAGPIVMKACSPDVPHKSDAGLVVLEVADPAAEFRRLRDKVAAMGARFDGVIVARKAQKGRELALGARIDPQFGPVVLVGDGGIYLEALKDFRLLLPPFGPDEVLEKLGELRVAPLLGALRGQPARDVAAFARMAARLGEAMLEWRGAVASVDINPVMVFETGQGALAVDALVERAAV